MTTEKSVPDTMQTIGYMQTLFKFKNGTPRQAGICQQARGTLTIDKSIFNNPEHSLEGLQDFSHAWIIFVFHKNNNAYFKAKVRPPRLDGRRIGLFATRAPYRPNPIGLTLAKIEKISGASIHFSGIDLLDGTPVLDVKPYIPQYDCPLGASHESVEKSNPSSHYHSASNQSPNVPPCPSSNFNQHNTSLKQIPTQDFSSSVNSKEQRKNSSNTEKIICSSATNSADVFAEDSTMLGVDSIENSTSGITEEDLDLRRKARNFCFTSKNYCLEDESLGQEKLQKTQAGEIFTHASSQGSEEDEKTNKTSTKNHNVCLSKFSSQSALIAVTNFVDLNSEAAVTPFFTTKESVALTPVVSTPLATAQADFTPLTKTQVDFTPLTTTPSESPTTKESMAFTLVASTLLTTTHTDSTPSDSTLLTTTLSESTPLTTTPVIEYTATSPAVATTPSFNTTSAQPLVSADWVVKAPVPKLTVFFTERSRLQLQKFSQHNKQQNYRLEFLQDSREVCQAICSILSEDPRSVYRRNLCKDSLYYFSVDKVHVTCWFFNNSAEVLRIQPMSYSEQSKSE